jgi:hypothetical protein
MATITKTFTVDDIDGSQNDVSTVQIALDDVSYEIDLSADNAARLREKLARFVDNGKKVRLVHWIGKRNADGPAHPPRWVVNRPRRFVIGLGTMATPVSERGRIPKSVQEAFDNAH